MSIEALTATWQRLNVSTEAMATLGAFLNASQTGGNIHLEIKPLMESVLEAIDPALLKDVSPQQKAATLGFIQSFFRQAIDLLENPSRAPGWAYEDPLILQSMGQASRMVIRVIEALAAQRPSLKKTLESAGTFLDVGTGVGWLAIEAAKSWKSMRIVGIDPFEPALALARKNVAESDVASRIELRQQTVQELEDRDRFSLAWLAGPFIPAETVKSAMAPLHQSLASGGTLIFGLFSTPADALAQALLKLKIVRNGGYPWQQQEAKALLESAGFRDIELFAPPGPTQLVVGRKA